MSGTAQTLADADYAPLLGAVEHAAKHAEHGIVALAVGHGDGGAMNPGGSGTAWADLAAEDGVELDDEGQIIGVFHSLLIDKNDLEEMKGTQVGPAVVVATGDTLIKKRALDKMRAILDQHNIRVLLLHTCTAGNDPEFMQLLSDRLQVYVRGHKLHVAYEGFATRGTVVAAYESDPPLPGGSHEWPIERLAAEVEPGDVPNP